MSESPASSSPPPAKGRAGCFILILALLVGGGWWWWAQRNDPAASALTFGKGAKRGMRGTNAAPIPVSVEVVKQEDFEEWLNIAGTVTPL
ncbi:MAG: hypothetical protein K8R87_14395, partial [Verrucomicrobia bacterium]|nr:hypothetical protein [Verrucomicrobiota bacterium]